jgi:Ser/Thr protein kinase RdoA (MazF antagonist)
MLGPYQQVAHRLSRAGIRRAMPLRATDGALVSDSGLVVHEFLPGTACTSPSRTQTLATMRHIAAYHAVLRTIPAPAAAPSVWTRVASVEYLLAELPRLSRSDTIVARALDRLAESAPLIDALPGQLIHGDIGPDNVLMDGDDVVAIVDFTPLREPVLFAVATAVFWYHVYGRDSLALDEIGASLAAAGPWTARELAAWPAMLLREALRHAAVSALVRGWPDLSGQPRLAAGQTAATCIAKVDAMALASSAPLISKWRAKYARCSPWSWK